ncbi:MAG: acylphosphatase [Bacteroidia bacterium]|nr:acylphosphatase [Bacteroidia bacterium]MBP7260250.1 acylphosphatase [Bacteroidia bacterium]MBP9180534.1 acylphosphatase [Bacteroidia bacterium]MBP9724496.1 acylphosphatase [Bacteroidia bacterium]
MKSVNITVRGKVQGVYYRQNTKSKATELGLNGFVRNEPDKSVYVEAEGEEQAVDDLIAWCRKGPWLASVEEVIVNEQDVKGFVSFEILR